MTNPTPPFPGLVLTDTKPEDLMPDKPKLGLKSFTKQAPKSAPITVEATHAAVADAVAGVLGGRLIRPYDKTWMGWQGTAWTVDDDEYVEARIKDLISPRNGVRKIIPYTMRKTTGADVPGLLASGQVMENADGILVWKATGAPATHLPVADDQWAQSAPNIQHVRRLLAGVLKDRAEFDADPTLLNCGGQVLRLSLDPNQPFTVEELGPKHLVSKSTHAELDMTATRPRFDKALAEILPDPEVRMYFQMAMGMSLYGVPRDHVFFVLRGRGRNGKTMLLELLAKILGDYGMVFPSSLIEVAQGEQHPTELMDLKGCRLAVVSETEQGKQWNTNRLKRLAGGDTQKARKMRADFEAFAATHTLWIASNNRPTMSAPDGALWERYRELFFPTQWWAPDEKEEQRIGKFAEADLGLPVALEAEAEGVLAWMIEGWVMYVNNGGKLTFPDAVHQASQEARGTATTFSVFVNESLMRGTDEDYIEVPAAFKAWKAYLASESMFSAERPTRSRDVGEFLMRERTYANFVPRKNGHDTAKVFGLRWTEAGRAWASLDDTTEKVRSEDGKVIQVPFGTSGERNAK